jgi:hypothetical protein
MSKSRHGKIDGQFVAVLVTTLDSPAWKAMSHGAKVLFVNLKRKVPRDTNRAFLSYREAGKALSSGPNKLREWYAELQHYGFIVLAIPHSLGVDGKGRAPHWRLTELGNLKGPDGLPEWPTRDFLKWDGELFDPKPYRHGKWDGDTEEKIKSHKKQNPVIDVNSTLLSTSVTPVLSTSVAPQTESVIDVDDIAGDIGVIDVDDISSTTTTVVSLRPSQPSPSTSLPSPSASLEVESIVAPNGGENNVVPFDERIAVLKATEKKRRLLR